MTTRAMVAFVAVVLVLPLRAPGQSTFQFQNIFPVYNIDAPVYDADGVRLSGADYLAELYGGVLPDSLTPALNVSFERVAVPFLTGTQAGYFISLDATAFYQVPGGSWVWLQVRAWDSHLGATYEDVAALGLGGYGESTSFYALGGDPGHLTPPQPLIGLESFSLRPVVPEPSVLALGLLAAGAFLLVRRCVH